MMMMSKTTKYWISVPLRLCHNIGHLLKIYDRDDDADGQEDTKDGVVVDDNIEDPDDNDEFLKGFCQS